MTAPGDPVPRAARWPRAVLATVAALAVAAAALAVAVRRDDPDRCPEPDRRVVGAWLPYWRQEAALASFVTNAARIREATPFWYLLAPGPDGATIGSYPGAEDPAVLAAVRAAGVPLVPIVTNFGRGNIGGPATGTLLADPGRRALVVRQLADLAAKHDYDGLDLDFEQLAAGSREHYSLLVEELAGRLHAAGRRLVLSVPAKTSEPGDYTNTRAFDYPRLGRAADVLRLMTYGLAAGAPVGPVAPLGYTDAVAAFAASVVDPAKVQLGVPLGAYDWPPPPDRPRSLTWAAAERLRRASAAARTWDPVTATASFRYRDGGTDRTVWFADAESVAARAAAVRRHGLAGVALWALGEEDPGTWPALPACRVSQPG